MEPAARHGWEAALRGLRADALDCVQTTLALIADHAHGPGAHLALGSHWRFPARRRDGVVGVRASVQDRLDEAAELLGMRVGHREGPIGGPAVRRLLDGAGPLCLVADAYDLPWVPYAGHRHMPHSFLLSVADGGYLAVDAYHNDTQWGPARPGAWTLSAEAVDRVLGDGAEAIAVEAGAEPPSGDRAATLAGNAARARAAAPDIERYAVVLRAGLDRPEVFDRLVLDIWLLLRERLLHVQWLADDPAASEVAVQAEAWRRLATASYVAQRRVQRGGPVDGVLVDDVARLLHADTEVCARLGGMAAAAGGDAVARAVMATLEEALGLDSGAIREAGTLRALPGFNSFVLVDIIDRVEQRLGVQLPDEVTAEDLQDVDGLCRLFGRAVGDRAGRWSG